MMYSPLRDVDPMESGFPNLGSSTELLESLENHDDVVSWINDIFNPVSPDTEEMERAMELTELDRCVTNLVGTLEIASEDTSAQVERIIDDISRGASRLTYDLHFMREGAVSLQGVLHSVAAKSEASLAAETNAALDRLQFLDTVRRNMEAAREVLREAESWGTLESDVTSLLGEKNYEKAAERLSEANKSMAVFENTSEYGNRRTLMVSLQNQLEAALSSALVAAVTSQELAVCRNYFTIFSNIQREAEFRNYYYGSRRGSLVEAWQGARLRDCEGASGPESAMQTFSVFLSSFYSSFLSLLQTERTSVPAIFPDPQPTLSALITSTLSALQPTFSQRLAAVSTYHGAFALRELISAYHTTEEFAVAIEKIFEKVGYAAILMPAPNTDPSAASQPQAHVRRRSSARMSISMTRRMSTHRASTSSAGLPSSTSFPLLEWDHELFFPFADFQADYSVLEQRLLDDVLKSALCTTSHMREDRARVLRERAVDVFGAAEDAMGRCLAFTHGFGAVGLVQAVDHVVSAFADASRIEGATRRGTLGGGLSAGAPASDEDLSDLNYTAQDWADIQSTLRLLEAVRVLLDRTTACEGKLRAGLVQISAILHAVRRDPGSPPSGTTRGAIQLLMQSSLNSAALHSLLNSVDPETSQPPPSSRGDALLAPTPPSPDPRRSSFTSTLPPNPFTAPLLTDSRTAISNLARTCQVALQDTLLAPLHAHLSTYASLPVWSSADAAKGPAATTGGAMNAVRVPAFSRSPSTAMQRVAEGLLTLPRLLEVHADDGALAFSLRTLPHVSGALLRALAEPAPGEHAAASPGVGMQHTRRAPSLALKPGQAQVQMQMHAQQQQAQDQSESASEALDALHLSPSSVTAVWLASLGRTLLASLTSVVLPRIPRLSPAGAAQLAADLGYLGNVVLALNVEWRLLGAWKRWAEMGEEEGRRRVREGVWVLESEREEESEEWDGAEGADGEEGEKWARESEEVGRIVARLRGWML
ncbi:hypothetical protein AcW1_001509 [Taiwanofungus camphoratus]|nr:hypothetical protein AcW1_001509 [Antrodia cinnamomea]